MSTVRTLDRIAKTIRLFEVEGTLETIEVHEYPDGREYLRLRLKGGDCMNAPMPVEEGGTFDYPVALETGKPFAARSFLVPEVVEGSIVERKRYTFDESGKGKLANCQTRDEYIAAGYKGQPTGDVEVETVVAEVKTF